VKGARKAREKLDKLVYGLIKERREWLESNIKSYDDLLTRLLRAQDATESSSVDITSTSISGIATSSRMSNTQVRDVMTIFIAGHETTANALGHSIFFLKILRSRKSSWMSWNLSLIRTELQLLMIHRI
jgi:cytochrome P450